MTNIVFDRPGIIGVQIDRNENFPGNRLPVIIYKDALNLHEDPGEAAEQCLKLLSQNRWQNNWTDSVYEFDHFHSNTHEVLCIISGTVTLLLGGPQGRNEALKKGDAIVLPAGVAHRRIASSGDFTCVGGYPDGRDYDLQRGDVPYERIRDNISAVPLPDTDPLSGETGYLIDLWKD